MAGKLIVIEGLDGSGKATQTKLVLEKLLEERKDVIMVSFPNYESQSSALVKMYLNGEIGELDDVNAFAAASFYSLDRYISYQTNWKSDYLNGSIILADRYTTSNISHQMAKLPKNQWNNFINWINEYEYMLLGIPSPDLVIYLDMPPSATKKLLEKRYENDESKKDLHEKNVEYTLACHQSALFAGEKLGWKIVNCCDSMNEPLTVKIITGLILKILEEEEIYASV